MNWRFIFEIRSQWIGSNPIKSIKYQALDLIHNFYNSMQFFDHNFYTAYLLWKKFEIESGPLNHKDLTSNFQFWDIRSVF